MHVNCELYVNICFPLSIIFSRHRLVQQSLISSTVVTSLEIIWSRSRWRSETSSSRSLILLPSDTPSSASSSQQERKYMYFIIEFHWINKMAITQINFFPKVIPILSSIESLFYQRTFFLRDLKLL